MGKINVILPDGRQEEVNWTCVPRVGETVVLDKRYVVLDVVHIMEQNLVGFGINIHLEVAMK